MARPYPYYPAFDGKKQSDIIGKVIELCGKRWKTTSKGSYLVRLMNNDHTKGKKIGDPGMDKWLSVHSTGFAADICVPIKDEAEREKVLTTIFDYFVTHSEELRISELHHYSWKQYGRGYRSSRGAGVQGVKVFTKDDNAGSYRAGGTVADWIHIEVEQQDVAHWEETFRALKV
jgi:hypothetical protein